MKKSSDNIGNQTCDLPACSAVSGPTAPPRAPILQNLLYKIYLTSKQPGTVQAAA